MKKKGKKAAKKEEKTDEKAEPSPSTPKDNAAASATDEKQDAEESTEQPLQSPQDEPATPSLSAQSKARSTSFRKASMSGPLSPGGPFSSEGGGETAPDIYRKHVARIEDLEKENKRLAKEAADAEKRSQKAEEELSDLRESDAKTGGSSEVEKLVRIGLPRSWAWNADAN
jgi:hypothetical protein